MCARSCVCMFSERTWYTYTRAHTTHTSTLITRIIVLCITRSTAASAVMSATGYYSIALALGTHVCACVCARACERTLHTHTLEAQLNTRAGPLDGITLIVFGFIYYMHGSKHTHTHVYDVYDVFAFVGHARGAKKGGPRPVCVCVSGCVRVFMCRVPTFRRTYFFLQHPLI